jgi:hypothetical protein
LARHRREQDRKRMNFGPVQDNRQEPGPLASRPVGPDEGRQRLKDRGFMDCLVLEEPMEPLESMGMASRPMGPMADNG